MSAPKTNGSVLVASGIALSRIFGFMREKLLSHVFGLGFAADAFSAASQVPNLLLMLSGEGVLSASFVPVYSKLLDEDDPKEASRVASAVGALLLAVTGIVVGIFVLAARPITSVLAFGLSGAKFELVVDLVQIMAVGLGFVVMSGWCLGILNSHRRFFLPYAAPVLWNVCQIVALYLMWVRGWDLVDAARGLALAVTIGGLAQLLIQLPTALRLVQVIWERPNFKNPLVRDVRRRFAPALLGRGTVQISAYLDLMLATLLATGAIAALIKAQLIATLPVSLFAMSVAAAELPELSRLGSEPKQLVERSSRSLRQITFWMFFASFILIGAGDLVVQMLYQGGEFSSEDATLVWFVLAVYALGLPAIGAGRLLKNLCYALADTRGPARIAGLRVLVSVSVALTIMFSLDRISIGVDGLIASSDWPAFAPLPQDIRAVEGPVRLGAVGLAAGSALSAWFEFVLLTLRCRKHLTRFIRPVRFLTKPALVAVCSLAPTMAVRTLVGDLWVFVQLGIVIATAAASYLTICTFARIKETQLVLQPLGKVAAAVTRNKSKH